MDATELTQNQVEIRRIVMDQLSIGEDAATQLLIKNNWDTMSNPPHDIDIEELYRQLVQAREDKTRHLSERHRKLDEESADLARLEESIKNQESTLAMLRKETDTLTPSQDAQLVTEIQKLKEERDTRAVALRQAAAQSVPIIPQAQAMPMTGVAKMKEISDFENSDRCYECGVQFGMFTRQHHCRACGRSFCDKHSTKKLILLPRTTPPTMHRVCDECSLKYGQLMGGYKKKKRKVS